MSSSSETKKLTEEEKRQIDLQRRDFFKGTIAILVIYGTFILAISILGIVSESARNTLFVNGFPFTVTFISGTILVIILLLIQLLNYESSPPPAKFTGENLSCPDYWILKETPQSELDKITDTQIRQLSRYYCENPNDTSLTAKIVLPEASPTEDLSLSKLRDISDKYNFTTDPASQQLTTAYYMKCNHMYPEYMAYMDKTNFKDNPTAIRCEYLRQCKSDVQGQNKRVIPWTSVCPTVPLATASAPAPATPAPATPPSPAPA